MTRVMAVTFQPRGPLHYLDPGPDTYRVGDWVLYPTDAGPEVAQVVWAPEDATGELSGDAQLPRCAGRANDQHLARDADHRQFRAQAEAIARALIEDRGLAMKVVGLDYLDQPERLVAIYYTAAERVDFRALVGELATALSCRVDLRQIGDRDAARVIGGIGSCGRELCCATWMTTIEPVTMRIAKDQNLHSNPMRIAGACGRLKCCLTYEHPLYRDFADRAPAVGTQVDTPVGSGQVVSHSVPDEAVLVRVGGPQANLRSDTVRCPLSEVCTSAGRSAPGATGEPN